MKNKKSLLLGLLVVPSLLLAGCGKSGDDESSGVKEQLTWAKTVDDVRNTFVEARKNYTLTVTELASENSKNEVGYSSYKVVVGDDAVSLDIGDITEVSNPTSVKRKNGGLYEFNDSFATELALVNNQLKQYNYIKTNDGWTYEGEVEDYYLETEAANSKNTVNSRKNDVEKMRSTVDKDYYFNAPWVILGYALDSKNPANSLASMYNKSTGTYTVPTDNRSIIKSHNYHYSTIDGENKQYMAYDGYLYYVYEASNGGAQQYYFDIVTLSNFNFKLDGEKLTSLSYDVDMKSPLLPMDSYIREQFTAKLHLEFTNFGTSQIDLGNAGKVSKEDVKGYEVSAEKLEAATEFYKGSSYTVSYKTQLTNNLRNFENPEYEWEFKYTADGFSTYVKYYDANYNETVEKYTIITWCDDTHYNEYTKNSATDNKWYRTSKTISSEYQTTQEYFGDIKETGWYNLESFNTEGRTLITENVEYSSTLKSYIYDYDVKNNKNTYDLGYSQGWSDLTFTVAVDAIYNFKEVDTYYYLNYYMTRHAVKYSPAEDMSAEGYLVKTISGINETTLDIPQI